MRIALIACILVLVACTMNRPPQKVDPKTRHYQERMAYPDDAGPED